MLCRFWHLCTTGIKKRVHIFVGYKSGGNMICAFVKWNKMRYLHAISCFPLPLSSGLHIPTPQLQAEEARSHSAWNALWAVMEAPISTWPSRLYTNWLFEQLCCVIDSTEPWSGPTLFVVRVWTQTMSVCVYVCVKSEWIHLCLPVLWLTSIS